MKSQFVVEKKVAKEKKKEKNGEMRLIDADAFINYLGLDCENSRKENIGKIVTLEYFDRQPTAYDVNRVVERLKENQKCYESKATYYDELGNTNNMDISDAITNAYSKAIEIIKEGYIE